MKAKEFLDGKTLTAIEVTGSKILNLVIDEEIYGLKVDLSKVKSGTKITRITEFEIANNVLTTDKLSLDLSEADMLFIEEEIVVSKPES
jgi:hypothetical protein